MTDLKTIDKRGLFADSYIIEGITEGECRSIFLDWAIGLPQNQNPQEWVAFVLDHYGPKDPDHPMTKVLREGLEKPSAPKRRGGRATRVPAQQ
ncbi:hypothetical protein [Cochlodiniinecator piscidefendens]|uniref:hypothetical protein n=1 Tax=Cochlodiniinecator piscidefendens TaxID=2715756 RepID=UPI00140E2EBF|nr:hypothetical protein [Cochlodiniinecator piscidefendens]